MIILFWVLRIPFNNSNKLLYEFLYENGIENNEFGHIYYI